MICIEQMDSVKKNLITAEVFLNNFFMANYQKSNDRINDSQS